MCARVFVRAYVHAHVHRRYIAGKLAEESDGERDEYEEDRRRHRMQPLECGADGGCGGW